MTSSSPRAISLTRSTLLCACLVAVTAALAGCQSTTNGGSESSTSRQALAVMGAAQSYAVLAGSTVTNTGPSTIRGDLGVTPGTAVTGFPPGLVSNGSIHSADADALLAQNGNTAAYGFLAGQPCTQDLSGTDLAGLTLKAGVYCFTAGAQLSGTLTLNAEGNPNATFVFLTVSTLITSSSSRVLVTNGGRECNVYWNVGSSATVGTSSTMVGNIFALTSIAMTTGASLNGRALAQNGAVTLDNNVISFESCAEATPVVDGGTTVTADGGTTSCSGTVCDCGCVDTNSDKDNCGACGNACGNGSTCTAGVCVPKCDGMHFLCDGACIVLTTDDNNCGKCGNSCAAGVVCNGGYCGSCPGMVCGNWCVDQNTDRNHCGTCGNKCAANETCKAGACGACATGSSRCGNTCLDTTADVNNCGGCGIKCAATETCNNGSCSENCTTP